MECDVVCINWLFCIFIEIVTIIDHTNNCTQGKYITVIKLKQAKVDYYFIVNKLNIRLPNTKRLSIFLIGLQRIRLWVAKFNPFWGAFKEKYLIELRAYLVRFLTQWCISVCVAGGDDDASFMDGLFGGAPGMTASVLIVFLATFCALL
jgi:hypothetical protein